MGRHGVRMPRSGGHTRGDVEHTLFCPEEGGERTLGLAFRRCGAVFPASAAEEVCTRGEAEEEEEGAEYDCEDACDAIRHAAGG